MDTTYKKVGRYFKSYEVAVKFTYNMTKDGKTLSKHDNKAFGSSTCTAKEIFYHLSYKSAINERP